MPLLSTRTHRTIQGPIEAYLVLDRFSMSAIDQNGRADFGVWLNQAAYEAGLAPIDHVTFNITKDGEPAIAEVRDGDNNVIVPARAAVLSYNQVKGAFPALFDGVTAAVEGYALTHPEFQGQQA